MASTPLTNLVPAQWREKVYFLYALAGVIVGSIQVGYATIDGAATPDWLKVALAVYAYLGLAVGGVAASNTNPSPISPADNQPAAVAVPQPKIGADGVEDVEGRHERPGPHRPV